jgi:hypothetical protein
MVLHRTTSLQLEKAECPTIAQAPGVEDGQPTDMCAAAARMRVPVYQGHRPLLHCACLDKLAERG